MDLEKLLTPVSEDAPCGPDLEPEGDMDFDMAYFDRMGELPENYFQPGVETPDGGRTPDRIFDPKTVDFREEAKLLDPLLGRTRDLRLIVLRAQWAILAGNFPKFLESLEWAAGLLETFNAEVHPQDIGDRRSTLSDLNDMPTVIQPLTFLGLTPTGDASLRLIKVSKGELTALQHEEDTQQAAVVDAIRSPQNAKPVEKMLEQILAAREALARITAACEAGEKKMTPDFSRLSPTINEMLEAITNARSDLAAAVEVEEAPAAAEEGAAPLEGVSAAAVAAAMGTHEVVSHLHAKRMLEACEAYYRLYEPSSATLLLVTQARGLIGKPLLEALELLLPDNVEQAVVNFSPTSGFVLNVERLRALTEDLHEDPDEPLPEPDPGPEVHVTNPAEAVVAIRSVEDYFRKFEKSSPIPTLLARARSYIDRDFQSIIEELIPKPEEY
jgi:type VI secretion system protein ImpA